MTTTFGLTINKWEKQIVRDITPAIIEGSKILYSDINANSPVKKGTFKSQNRIKTLIYKKGKLIGGVENIGLYPERVEKGFRKKAVNWHLANGKIKRSKGANTFEDSIKRKKNIIINMLKG